MSQETVEIGKNSKKWGITFSTVPSGNGTEIETPQEPSFTGTLDQCRDWLYDSVKRFASGGVFYSFQYFFKNRPVIFANSMEGRKYPEYSIYGEQIASVQHVKYDENSLEI